MFDTRVQSYQLPTRIVHGVGAIASIGDVTHALGIRRPLIVAGPDLLQTGLLEKGLDPLRRTGVDPVIYGQVRPNPDIAVVDEGARVYREEHCEGMIGFGGGSSLDAAKGIGVVVVHGGSIADYEYGKKPMHSRIPPLIAVPTTAGSGSEVTLWAVITDPARKVKFNVGGTVHICAAVALIDPSLSVGLPRAVTAGTGMDALAHAIECYTMAYHQPFTDAVSLIAMEYIGRYLRVAFAQGQNMEARYYMSQAAMLAGLAYGSESAGAAHAMSQTAGGIRDVPHGALTARLLGPVMEYNCLAEPTRFARIAQALGHDVHGLPEGEAARRAVDAVYELTEDLEIPTLQDLGFLKDQIPMLAEMAARDSQSVGNPRDVDVHAYLHIYSSAFEKGRRKS